MDDLTGALVDSLAVVFAEQEADDRGHAAFIRSIGAIAAEQARADRDRALCARLEARVAEAAARRAAMEREYGPLDVMYERMMDRPGMATRLMMRASFNQQ